MDLSAEMLVDLDRHENLVSPTSELLQAERPDSTCTNFPNSFGSTDHADNFGQGRPDSTCTTFPNNFEFNPAERPDTSTSAPTGDLAVTATDITHRKTSAAVVPADRYSEAAGAPDSRRAKLKRRLPIPVRPLSNEQNLNLKRRASLCEEGSPWLKYKKCMEGAPGKTCLAYEVRSPGTVVAIKQYKDAQTSQTRVLTKPSHTNIVKILHIFIEQKTVYFAYERMEVTLQHLYSVVSLQELEISYTCKEILHGLWYIHEQLGICHTRIQSDNIFISAQGVVKIADIGACMLDRQRGSKEMDIKAVGKVLTELMEPGTRYSTGSINLLEPEKWSQEIRDFRRQTDNSSILELLQAP
ncbi:uncharacterized protein ATNIH1004_009269 [Aspergillus tanneri]|uniref:Protein kinase domain-containing protein n=1 Tax=Aspergillus tanneri TaxID=1220188 RepID=A0A5M9MDM1_9EURO|nr:uncharacterized protein ATNIH1004_009269 [Aspergillus tanneri]KAA8645058.1 hypothetical protein ATNIH1004_009269 [Aspergillus tanneri]